MATAPVAPAAPVAQVEPVAPSSSWFDSIPSFGFGKKDEQPTTSVGGRRRKLKKMRGGTPFRPFIARSVALNASPFKGGRRRKTRRHKKKSRRHSRRR